MLSVPTQSKTMLCKSILRIHVPGHSLTRVMNVLSRNSTGYLKVLIAPALALMLLAQLHAQQETFVAAGMDLYMAGGYNDRSGAHPPALYAFSAEAHRTMTFSVAGMWTCANGSNPGYGPDGENTGDACYPRASITDPIGPFSGYELTDFTGALAGIFLEDTLPVSAPPALRFYISDSSQGGIPTDFKVLSPLIGQVFFIGDGLTGTGTGTRQEFVVPPTATRLYLGYVDSCSSSGYTSPGCYGDNAGTLVVFIRIHDLH